MKIRIIILLGLFFPVLASAQTDVALDPEFGGRISVSVDKRITRGLHVSLEEEVRFDQNFGSLDRLQTTLGLNYKVNEFIKLGVGYALINGYSSTNQAFKNMRHRFMVDVKGTLKVADWNFSLKERLQLTHRTGDYNIYQNPANALMLKSRLMAKYRGFGAGVGCIWRGCAKRVCTCATGERRNPFGGAGPSAKSTPAPKELGPAP